MDFFAQAYNTDAPSGKDSPMHSPRPHGEGAAQGYGCEANAHLRRASLGLEIDQRPRALFGYTTRHGAAGSPSSKNTHQRSEHSNVMASPSYANEDSSHNMRSSPSPSATPTFSHSRRTSVSNPCLLHHTNSNGRGVVRPPIMLQSYSSPQLLSGISQLHGQNSSSRPQPQTRASFSEAHHQSPIAEGPELKY
ncbi:hypothetical protein BGZ68_004856 [Mortierella alpina]|nr:hypothetical protein BGZ68_004856 [Mortierella alpina]